MATTIAIRVKYLGVTKPTVYSGTLLNGLNTLTEKFLLRSH